MPSSPPIRVLIADDNRTYRRGVRLRLEQVRGITVVGEVSTGSDASMAARSERADVVLMDLQMPDGTGLDATRALAGPGVDDPIAVVVVTNHAADRFVLEALDSGAVGFLLKNHGSSELLAAIQAAARGSVFVSPAVTVPVVRELVRRKRRNEAQSIQPSALSEAEVTVVRQLTCGFTSNEALARSLHVSVNTVRTQLRSALKKTGLTDRTQLALWADREGLGRDELHPKG